jgi:hypothetical protein
MRPESGPGEAQGNSTKFFKMMVARDGVEAPTPAFSALSLNPFSVNNLIRQEGHIIVTIL